jgi:hypothetical protein
LTLRQPHILFPILVLLAGSLEAAEQAGAEPEPSAQKRALWRKKTALEIEYRLVRADREAYYLVIDLPAGEVVLKAGGRLLRTCPIQSWGPVPHTRRKTLLFHMANRIDPVTPEPGNHGLRLRGRRLPLDFIGRLIEGPREISRLYFSPSLLIQPVGSPTSPNLGHLELRGRDVKALGSALQPGNAAILIPPLEIQSGAPR